MTNQSKKQNKKKKQSSSPKSFLRRCFVLLLIFVLFSGAIVVKLKQIQIDESNNWQQLADRQQLKNVTIKPSRGSIYDAKGRVLAQSAAVWTIEAAPDVMDKSKLNKDFTLLKNPARVATDVLAPILGLSNEEKDTLYENLSDTSKRYYKVKGQVDQETADNVRKICNDYRIKGIYLTADTKRVYPYQELGATVLGFVGDGGEGREGLEFQYNETLTGTAGRQILPVNAAGTEMPSDAEYPYYPAEDGKSIVLTIDADMQQVLEKHLADAVNKFNVQNRGMGIVVDVNTGAILALAAYPAYNPNMPNEIIDEKLRVQLDYIYDKDEYIKKQGELRATQWRNKILSDTYEPGSVFKIISAAAAYDSGTYNENSKFYCGGGIYVEGWDDPIRCARGDTHGELDLKGAIIKSCNECFVRISAGVGPTTWYDYLNAFGLTEPTGVDLPGEPSQKSLNVVTYRQNQMTPINLAVCSFGQANKYTALQMIMAVSAAVNGGNLMQPYIVQRVIDASGNVVEETQPVVKRQVISEKTSRFLCEAMEEMVATSSSGQSAYVAGYHVGGKSGTSQKIELKYNEDREEYIASFFGFAPANDPKVAVLIVLDEPKDDSPNPTYFGGRLAGPTVRNVLREILPMLGVEPDYNTDEELSRKPVQVPRVIGEDLNTAQIKLNTGHLSYVIVGQGPTVNGQYPESGTSLNYGGTVYLYTDPAIGAEIVTVPDVSGKTPSAAITQLKNLGLNVMTTGAPDSGTGVKVREQSILPDTSVQKGTLITLTLEDESIVAIH